MTTLRIHRLPHAADLPLPAYATDGAAGMDLRAAFMLGAEPTDDGGNKFFGFYAMSGNLHIEPGERVLVPTGLTMAIPPGFEGQIRPRSGLALRDGLTVLNAPGTIDSDFRGEVKVLVVNLSSRTETIKRGDRIAQLVIAPVARVSVEEVDALDDTERGAGGFGSTGVQ